MGIQIVDKKLKAAYAGTQKIKMAMYQGKKIWSAGSTVTYMVDTNVSYTEEVDSDTSCLSPKTFTPSKEGWSFVGWREDRTASASVLGSKVMADSPITLYAVFRQTVTVTWYNGSTTASTSTGYNYYNNGAAVNPSFALTQASLPGWTARGWSTGNAANGGITYQNGAAFTRGSSVTLYGMYQQAVTVTFYNGSTAASGTTGTRYYCPGSGKVLNPTFTLTQAGLSGWTARGWSTGTAGNSGITYNNGAAFTRDSNITLYGMYQQTITLSYNGNGASGGSTAAQSGTRYYNSNGATVNSSFTLRANGFSRSGCTFKKWALGSIGGTQYAAGAGITLSASAVMYAVWTGVQAVITLSKNGVYVDGGMYIDINKPNQMLVYDAAVDCSLYRGVQFKKVQVYAYTEHEGTGAAFGMYESGGGAFLPLVNFWRDWVSAGGVEHKEQLVKDGETATLYFAKASGTTMLYVGYRPYLDRKPPYGGVYFYFTDVTLIPR